MVDIKHFNEHKRKGGDNVDYPDIPSTQAQYFEVDVTHHSEQNQTSEVRKEVSSQESKSSCFEPEISEKSTMLSGMYIHRLNQIELNYLLNIIIIS